MTKAIARLRRNTQSNIDNGPAVEEAIASLSLSRPTIHDEYFRVADHVVESADGYAAVEAADAGDITTDSADIEDDGFVLLYRLYGIIPIPIFIVFMRYGDCIEGRLHLGMGQDRS
ncbi:hypothetical protein NHQ30_011264 [Ciborinia camelliae]|nr:hypothetical protein NHQ30_011264 [Ciborinia camelliae]